MPSQEFYCRVDGARAAVDPEHCAECADAYRAGICHPHRGVGSRGWFCRDCGLLGCTEHAQIGDYLTRENYRPGLEFEHLGNGPYVTSGPLTRVDADLISFIAPDGREWFVGMRDLRVTGYAVVPDATSTRVVPVDPVSPRTHRGITPDQQDRALELRRDGLSWNAVADAMGWPRTTDRGYSLARWAAFQARRRNGEDIPAATRRTSVPVQPRFGIEIEFNRNPTDDRYVDRRDDIVATARANGLAAELEDYNHGTRTYWKMIGDATVSGGEFVSPPLPRDASGLRQVRTALAAVRGWGQTPGRNQGMHVHHEVADLSAAQMTRLIDLLRVWQAAIMAAVPEYRYDGSNGCGAGFMSDYTWSQLRASAVDGHLRARGSSRYREYLPVDRYVAFNFNATLAYGTVEFRGLGNTLNYSKVSAWIQVTGAVVDYARGDLPIPTPVLGGIDTAAMLATLRDAGLVTQRAADRFAAMATADRVTSASARLASVDGAMCLAA